MKRILLLILLALLSAYREVWVLIDRGSWSHFVTWLPNWTTEWDGFWKLFDLHHSSYGMFIMVFAITLRLKVKYLFKLQLRFLSDDWNFWLTEILHVLIVWQAFFYIRNIGMHILFMNPEFMRWKYLLPIVF